MPSNPEHNRQPALLLTHHTVDRFMGAFCCLCFVLATTALVLIGGQPPATGYEPSLYASLPPTVWVCLLIGMAGGTAIAVHQAFSGRADSLWVLALGLLWLVNLTVLLLPLARGYFLYASSDTIAHWQWSEETTISGHVQPTNRYPVTHVWAAAVALVCGLPPGIVVGLLPVLCSLLFASSTYLLANEVLPKKPQAMLAAIGASTLFFGYYHVAAYPQVLSMMVLPLAFYLYFKRSKPSSMTFRILFVAVLLLVPFFHPATALLLIACLLAAELAGLLWRAGQRVGASTAKEPTRIALEPILIALVAFLAWISTFTLFGQSIHNLMRWLTGEIREIPRVAELETAFALRGPGVPGPVELAVRMYGDNLFYLFFSFVALILISRGFVQRDSGREKLFVLAASFLASGLTWVGIFVITLQISFGRLLGSNFMMWAAPVLAAFALHRVFERTARLRVPIVATILFCGLTTAIIGVYHSPIILQPNWQILLTDVQGAGWFGTHTDPEAPLATMGVPPAFALGKAEVPQHLNRTAQSDLGAAFDDNTYLLVTERSKIVATHPVLSRAMIADQRFLAPGFEREDFDQLERDPTVNKLYTNGEFDAFLIRSSR